VAVAHDAEALAVLRAALGAAGARPLSEKAVELARIRAGWPAWGAELTETVLPPEAGIEEETISYSKGCYVGQETLARMRTYGHPTRGLAGLRQLAGSGEKPALPVPLSALGEEKSRGTLTSWGWHPGCGGVGLALVRRELTQPGTRLAGDNREFEVTSFPLW
jgi:folate-binding protein YgfZ